MLGRGRVEVKVDKDGTGRSNFGVVLQCWLVPKEDRRFEKKPGPKGRVAPT